jgi:glucose-1-phosphate thymidylyltransferase
MTNSESGVRKGIILAGGHGTRLYPATAVLTKQLLPVYDKPLIYYPLSVLLYAGIRNILIICTPESLSSFQNLLLDGSQLGISISYATQDKPKGLVDAFIIGREFIGDDQVALILGDNIFFGQGLGEKLSLALDQASGATVFTYPVKNPEAFGVISYDKNGLPESIEEKPKIPKSNYAITGLYFFDNDVVNIATTVENSERGELEITDVIRTYMNRGNLRVHEFGRGFAWFDTGTHDSLLQAAMFVEAIQNRQGLKIACLEEIAFRNGFISKSVLKTITRGHSNDYCEYLEKLSKESKSA